MRSDMSLMCLRQLTTYSPVFRNWQNPPCFASAVVSHFSLFLHSAMVENLVLLILFFLMLLIDRIKDSAWYSRVCMLIWKNVDDIFCAFDSKDEMDKFFQNLNKVHSSVSSKEVEADGQLTYLDVLLTKNEKEIETTIYRKNTHTGLYNKWESLSPIQYKKVPYKACYIVPTKFAAHTNWSTKNFNILNPVFLAMDTRTGL